MATIAVTLQPVRVIGRGISPGVVAVMLPRPFSVAAVAHAANGASGAISLKHVTVAGTALKPNVILGAVVLPRLVPSGVGGIGIANTITSVHPVLKAITVSATGIHQVAAGAITLKRVTVSGVLTNGIHASGGAAVTLKRIVPGIYLVNKYADLVYSVMCITGNIYADGSAVFQFRGRAGLGVSWSITVGSGAIAPLGPSYTDDHGIAFAKYDAGGYTGPLTIGTAYVP